MYTYICTHIYIYDLSHHLLGDPACTHNSCSENWFLQVRLDQEEQLVKSLVLHRTHAVLLFVTHTHIHAHVCTRVYIYTYRDIDVYRRVFICMCYTHVSSSIFVHKHIQAMHDVRHVHSSLKQQPVSFVTSFLLAFLLRKESIFFSSPAVLYATFSPTLTWTWWKNSSISSCKGPM